MNRIRLLPEQVANQIAAGEVVERPASVVKELIENSLDANATRIGVEIIAGGRALIRVTDDGCGMSRDDALLCLERHATSKIQTAADLSRVATMGFRGEAIPSIASVSRFVLTTRERDESTAAATQVIISGGKILEVREAGAPPGTSVEVRSLFFNLPARRKFLRSDDTERAHIQHYVVTAALAHPGVAFTLGSEGRVLWQLAGCKAESNPAGQLAALRERMRLLLGDPLALVAIDTEGELEPARFAPAEVSGEAEIAGPSPIRLWGWIGAPGISRATRDDQYLFVNGRPVENRGLNAALLEGYHTALMKGRYPLACVFLELDPGEVDVNIHPAKREVRFHRERAVRRFVSEALRAALKAHHTERSIPAEPAPPPQPPAPRSQARQGAVAVPGLDRPQPELPHLRIIPAQTELDELARRLPDQPLAQWPVRPPVVPPAASSSTPPPAAEVPTGGEPRPPAPARPPAAPAPGPLPREVPAEPAPLLSVPLRLVGVIGRLYVVLESDRGLVLVDQHAAHERVLYEQMLRRLEDAGSAPSQRLLLPETIELSARDAAFLRENLAALGRLGVGLSEFGERTFLLDALPPFAHSSNARRFALDLIDELKAAGNSPNAWRLGEQLVAKTVCRHAVKARDPLGGPELDALIDALRRCDMPYTCPHGRPTILEIGYRDLEKRFGRVV